MPGFTTHYIFGLNTYKTLEHHALKKLIHDHHKAYSLGLQGPDIFFYYLPSYVVHEKNIGSLAHTENTGEFLSHLIESCHLFTTCEEIAIAQAYIMGFMGHYLLDCRCHPYIYYRTHYQENSARYLGTHVNLESDIDTSLLNMYKNKLPSVFRQDSTIALTGVELHTIATILHYVYSKTYPDLKISRSTMYLAIRSMQLGTFFLHDSLGKKKALLRKGEALTLGYPVISPLIGSDTLCFYKDPLNTKHKKWRNPWDTSQTSCASFLELMTEAKNDYSALLPKLYRLFQTDKDTSTQQVRLSHILQRLGNRSYHSGL